MHKKYAFGAQNSRKYRSIQPETHARIIKQPHITHNGPHYLSGNALPLLITMF